MADFNQDDFDLSLNNFYKKLEQLNSSTGRATNGTKHNTVPRSAKTNSSSTKEQVAYEKLLAKANKKIEAGIRLTEKEQQAVKDATVAQKNLTKEQKEAGNAQKYTNKALKDFGLGLIDKDADMGGVFKGLSGNLKYTGTTFGKVAGAIAFGVSYAIGGLQEFAKNAADMGAFADLSKFSVGSVTSIKLMSGLGGAFMKVIEDSQGGFKAFGANSQEAAENLSNLSRGLKLGSGYLNSTLRTALGTDLVKSVDRASNAAAAMGMTDEERAKLSGAIIRDVAYGAKNEKDAQQRYVKQIEDTLVSTRNLSNTFGTSTRELQAAMQKFRETTAGRFAAATGNIGAVKLAPSVEAFGVTADAEVGSRIAKALSEGNGGAARGALSQAGGNDSQFRALDLLEQAIQGTKGGADTDAFNKNVKALVPAMEALGMEGDRLSVTNSDLAAPLAKLLDTANKIKTGGQDDTKEAPATSETNNIKSMNNLTAALDSLRNLIIGLTAGIALLVGSIGTIAVSGGIFGALSTKGGLKNIFGSIFSKKVDTATSGKGAMDGIKDWWASRKGASSTATSSKGAMDSIKDWWASRKGASSAAGGALADSASSIGSSGSMGKTLKELGGGAGKGIKDLVTGIGAGLGKGIELLLRGLAAGISAFANPAVLAGAAILSASIALIGAGIAGATWLMGAALPKFAEGLKSFADIDGGNLAAIGSGLAAMGAGAVVFAAGMVAATATSLVTGLMSLFGAKSPMERILELVPVADKISMIGEGMFKFGSSIGLINDNLKTLDLDALDNFKNALIEISNIDLPSLDGLAIPQISTNGIVNAAQQQSPMENILNGNTAVTPEVISQLMSYLTNIGSDLAAIRGNTKQVGYDSPVRLS